MFCPNCGNQIKENAAFCTHCGRKIVIEDLPAQQAKQDEAEK